MTTTRRLSVFLCHGREDKERVRELHRLLTEAGYQPWLDEIDLLGGQDWETEIRIAIRRSDAILVCLSPSWISQEGFIQKEIRIALDIADEKPPGTLFVIPLRLDECQVPERLARLHYVDAFDGNYQALQRSLRARAKQVGAVVGPPARRVLVDDLSWRDPAPSDIVNESAPTFVFVSYCREDAEVVSRVVDLLNNQRCMTAVVDQKMLATGAELTPTIVERLDGSSRCVLVWSRAASSSPWVSFELDRYVARCARDGRPLGLVVLDTDGGLPAPIRSTAGVSTVERSSDKWESRLIEALRAPVKQAPAPPKPGFFQAKPGFFRGVRHGDERFVRIEKGPSEPRLTDPSEAEAEAATPIEVLPAAFDDLGDHGSELRAMAERLMRALPARPPKARIAAWALLSPRRWMDFLASESASCAHLEKPLRLPFETRLLDVWRRRRDVPLASSFALFALWFLPLVLLASSALGGGLTVGLGLVAEVPTAFAMSGVALAVLSVFAVVAGSLPGAWSGTAWAVAANLLSLPLAHLVSDDPSLTQPKDMSAILGGTVAGAFLGGFAGPWLIAREAPYFVHARDFRRELRKAAWSAAALIAGTVALWRFTTWGNWTGWIAVPALVVLCAFGLVLGVPGRAASHRDTPTHVGYGPWLTLVVLPAGLLTTGLAVTVTLGVPTHDWLGRLWVGGIIGIVSALFLVLIRVLGSRFHQAGVGIGLWVLVSIVFVVSTLYFAAGNVRPKALIAVTFSCSLVVTIATHAAGLAWVRRKRATRARSARTTAS